MIKRVQHIFGIVFILTLFCNVNLQAQHTHDYRNEQLDKITTAFRLPPAQGAILFEDLDKDGDPDLMKYGLPNGLQVIWIDDDDDMKLSDMEGDMDNDCLLIDLNQDGKFGSEKDLNIDWSDEDGDGIADLQCIVDNGFIDQKGKWTSHYVWFIDNDKDGVLGYINWDNFLFEGWDHEGKANFFTDYNGKSTMLKVHVSTWNLKELEYNWENPFLFYDHDDDGLTEMAIRIVDEPLPYTDDKDDLKSWSFSKRISYVQMTFDMDNDSEPANELDYDMSLKFMKGKGYDYADQIHEFKNIEGLAAADYLFDDPRWRHTTQLIYPDHETGYSLTFDRGDWGSCWFVFDEDDDCHRWERVEFYDNKDPFKIGTKNGGLDHNPQADPAGDRGEWDEDFSGSGNLYLSPMDGRLHLLGAEVGYWRIDQNATYYQGWQGWRGPNLQPEDFDKAEPDLFGTMKYEDLDNNGYMDFISMDMDGDHLFEHTVSLLDLGLDDRGDVFNPAKMDYPDYQKVYEEMADKMWQNASTGVVVAKDMGINTAWYSHLMHPKSSREKYHNGYWLSFYLYKDMLAVADHKQDKTLKTNIQRAYFSSNWKGSL